MQRIEGPHGRPYPCVQGYIRADGSLTYTAAVPMWIKGKYRSKYLGCFDIPENARAAVLKAQAERLEAKAAAYRTEAEELLNARAA
jgi:hypothetical protein